MDSDPERVDIDLDRVDSGPPHSHRLQSELVDSHPERVDSHLLPCLWLEPERVDIQLQSHNHCVFNFSVNAVLCIWSFGQCLSTLLFVCYYCAVYSPL